MRKKTKKIRLAYRIVTSYLINLILLVLVVVLLVGGGIRVIEEKFFEKYKNNAEESMSVIDQEILQLKNILMYSMRSEEVQLLRGRKEQLSLYEQITYRLQIKNNLSTLASQYRLVQNMGIYIPEYAFWINAQDWDTDMRKMDEEVIGERLEMRNNNLYMVVGIQDKSRYVEGYIRFNARELKSPVQMPIEANAVLKLLVNGEVLEDEESEKELSDTQYRKISVKSDLYPIEMQLYVPNYILSFQRYLYLFGGIAILVSIITAILFAGYLNRAIHKPLKNMVDFIEGMNKRNYKDRLKHQGNEEFQYVTLEFNQMKEHLEQYIEEGYTQELAMKQMELDHLQEQIKPHFLYNCFSNISNMCKTGDLDGVERLSMALSKYYRYITRTGHSMVTLEAEYEHMKNYLMVQKIRFRERVDIWMDELPAGVGDEEVPRLILQPIVENAYKYVFERVERDGVLRIRVKDLGDRISITIEDSGFNTSEETIEKASSAIRITDTSITGLGNLQKRMQFLNEESGMEITRSELGGISNKMIIVKRG